MKKTTVPAAAMLGFALVFGISFMLAGWAILDRFDDARDRREAQAEFNAAITAVALENCREIEKLKKSRRDQAQAAYNSRHADFALIGVTVTPAIDRRLRQSLETNLERFKAEPCPRPVREN